MVDQTSTYAEIIIPVPLEGYFTYAVPSALRSLVSVGSVVRCSFGPQLYFGVVRKLSDKKPEGLDIKNISEVIYEGTCIPESILNFWDWMSDYYLCSIGDVLKAAIPASVIPTSKPVYSILKPEAENELKGNDKIIFDALQNQAYTESYLKRQVSLKSIKPLLNRLMEKGILEKSYPDHYRNEARKETFVFLNKKYKGEKEFGILLQSLKSARAKRHALLAVFENQFDTGITKNQLRNQFNVSLSIYNQLIDSKLLNEVHKTISEEPNLDSVNFPFLSLEQEKAYDEISRNFKKHNTVLLHGVTSSGKTEIYFHLIKNYLKAGRQVLILLPEITLSNNVVPRYIKVFGDAIKVFHSKIGEKERAHIWHGVRNNQIKLVLGVRSAVFLPFVDLGLAIVDEEHENTYKQDDPAPRYHARDALSVLGNYQKSHILLGSATPSVQSYYNAANGKFGLVQLFKRHNEVALPKVVVEDLLDCYKKNKLKKHFSYTLISQVEDALEKKEQVILFQNRRGFAPSVECKECGYVHLCPHCNVTLTVHKTSRKLECHYCGYQENILEECPECHSPKIIDRGMGTEKIEDEIRILFPKASYARIDTNTAGKTQNVQQVFRDFKAGRMDILVGTQMVSKGLDFDNVGVVGVMNADNLINFPNFLASERSFQLLTQVAGRAGRKHGNGKVVIQTHQPEHPIFDSVESHDYLKFYGNEIGEREIFKYPPFVRLIYINMRHQSEPTVEAFAQQLAQQLIDAKHIQLLGPDKPGLDKIKNFYYRRIILKTGKGLSRKTLKEWLLYHVSLLKSGDAYRSVQISFDADPMG